MSNQQEDTAQEDDSVTKDTSNDNSVEIDNRSIYHQISRVMLLHAKRTIDIYAFKLDPEIVNHKTVIQALKLLPQQSSSARIRILVQESRESISECAAFVEMARKYSSLVEFRKVVDLIESTPSSWMTVDQDKYITRTNSYSYHGKACHQDKSRVRDLTKQFEEIWEKSEPDPEMRRLVI